MSTATKGKWPSPMRHVTRVSWTLSKIFLSPFQETVQCPALKKRACVYDRNRSLLLLSYLIKVCWRCSAQMSVLFLPFCADDLVVLRSEFQPHPTRNLREDLPICIGKTEVQSAWMSIEGKRNYCTCRSRVSDLMCAANNSRARRLPVMSLIMCVDPSCHFKKFIRAQLCWS